MGGLAFLAMLGTYAIVLYWYALNHERDHDGDDGILGVRSQDRDHIPHSRLKSGHVLLKMRGALPKHGISTTSVDAVRNKAARLSRKAPEDAPRFPGVKR